MSDTPKKTAVKKTTKATSPAAAGKTTVKAAAPAKKTAAPKAATPAKESKVAHAPKAEPTHEQISRRAYEIWAGRGRNHGTHAHDWAQAEHDLKHA